VFLFLNLCRILSENCVNKGLNLLLCDNDTHTSFGVQLSQVKLITLAYLSQLGVEELHTFRKLFLLRPLVFNNLLRKCALEGLVIRLQLVGKNVQ